MSKRVLIVDDEENIRSGNGQVEAQGCGARSIGKGRAEGS